MRLKMAALAGVVVLALSGCVSPSGFAIFDGEPGPEDSLPADFDNFTDGQLDGVDLGTVRLAATHDGHDLYLLKRGDGSICLAVANGKNSVMGCGANGDFGVSGFGAGSYEVRPEPIGQEDGWTVVSDNIRASLE